MKQQPANAVEHPRMTRDMEVGDFAKVHLLGESPWAEVIELTEDGFKGRINNVLFAEMSETDQARFNKQHFGTVSPLPVLHDYRRNDEVLFIEGAGHWKGQWVPSDCPEQTGDGE